MRTRLASPGVLAASLAALLAGASTAQAADTNVALNTLATATVGGLPALPCTLGSGPENAVDGAASNIYTDKWCVPSGRPTLTLLLPIASNGFTVSRIVVKHAGVAGESAALNTRAFRLLTRTSTLSPPTTVATVTTNTANRSDFSFTSAIPGVRQVQLVVDVPTQGTNQATRIYEVEVGGTPTPLPPIGGGTGGGGGIVLV